MFSPILVEVLIRVGIGLDVKKLKNPGLYADTASDDRFFQLRLLWRPDQANTVVERFHPLLGWAPKVTAKNPLGLSTDEAYEPAIDMPVVLFYGDSFVAGSVVPSSERIPQILDSRLPGYTVYNYGVGGYGLGQIYLRFDDSHTAFRNPIVIIDSKKK